jgi:hypothetical protein
MEASVSILAGKLQLRAYMTHEDCRLYLVIMQSSTTPVVLIGKGGSQLRKVSFLN